MIPEVCKLAAVAEGHILFLKSLGFEILNAQIVAQDHIIFGHKIYVTECLVKHSEKGCEITCMIHETVILTEVRTKRTRFQIPIQEAMKIAKLKDNNFYV